MVPLTLPILLRLRPLRPTLTPPPPPRSLPLREAPVPSFAAAGLPGRAGVCTPMLLSPLRLLLRLLLDDDGGAAAAAEARGDKFLGFFCCTGVVRGVDDAREKPPPSPRGMRFPRRLVAILDLFFPFGVSRVIWEEIYVRERGGRRD